MSWKRDRDLLIAQTMAFVQSVAGRKAEAGQSDVAPAATPVERVAMDALDKTPASKAKEPPLEPVRDTAPTPPLAPVPAASLMRTSLQVEVADEIRARIAGFRAHQERFSREREEYFSQTLTRLRDSLKDAPPPRPGK